MNKYTISKMTSCYIYLITNNNIKFPKNVVEYCSVVHNIFRVVYGHITDVVITMCRYRYKLQPTLTGNSQTASVQILVSIFIIAKNKQKLKELSIMIFIRQSVIKSINQSV